MSTNPPGVRVKQSDVSSAPLDDYIIVTPGPDALVNGVCRCIFVDADGTLDLTTPEGEDRDGSPVIKGYNPKSALKIRGADGPSVIEVGY